MANSRWLRVDRIMRWLHLYTGLFFVPWMLVYATSAFCLNHNQYLRDFFGIVPPSWQVIREVSFVPDDTFPSDPVNQARAIVQQLELDGPHRIQGRPTPNQLVIFRMSGAGHYRITWRRSQSRIIVEQQQPFSAYRLLHYLHFRGGYGQQYVAPIVWAVIVDAVAISLWLWVISGIYLWLRKTNKRKLGTACLVGGMVLFIILTALLCT